MEELVLTDILEQEGVKFKDENERVQVLKELKEAVEQGNFHFIVLNGRRIGFFVFRRVVKDGRIHTYIDNLLVYKRFRNHNSLLNLRGYFRQMAEHKSQRFYFWHNQKRDKFFYGS